MVEEPPDFQVDRLDKIRLKPGAISSLSVLQKNGFELVMITNQDGLGTNSFAQNDFQICQDLILHVFASQGVVFKDILICPHFEKDNCQCRKPKTGLLTSYLSNNDIDWSNCYVIGDRPTDLQLAKNLNCTGLQISDQLTWLEIQKTVLSVGRQASIERKTKETDIKVTVNLDGQGTYQIHTGLRFFDHMLEQLSKHSGIDMKIHCNGDLDIDEHHTVEDVALALGSALKEALHDKRGIARYGFLLPMDETLAQAALDLSGRAFFVFDGKFNREYVGDLPTELVPHFFRSLCDALGANLNLKVEGDNTHHMIEACFKAVAKSLQQSVKKHSDSSELPSTKGVL
ncbi:MAG: bifunctional histidinol-phosphatase/imidazoleglycerol-phosphate dehydratase HisB [Pseudobdellovibrionaceae bacterium]